MIGSINVRKSFRHPFAISNCLLIPAEMGDGELLKIFFINTLNNKMFRHLMPEAMRQRAQILCTMN